MLFDMLQVRLHQASKTNLKLDFQGFIRAAAVFKLGGDNFSDGFGYLTQQALAAEEEPAGEDMKKKSIMLRDTPLLKERDILKHKLRLVLLNYFYSDSSKEAKKMGNLQVNVMMQMLQEHLDPLNPMEEAGVDRLDDALEAADGAGDAESTAGSKAGSKEGRRRGSKSQADP